MIKTYGCPKQAAIVNITGKYKSGGMRYVKNTESGNLQ